MPSVWILTGGIGTGKSTVSAMLADLGAVIVNADEIGHEVLKGEALESVASVWPQTVVDGEINRSRLASIVFSDRSALNQLEDITHPLITEEIERRCRSLDDRDIAIVELSVPRVSPYVGYEKTIVTVLDDQTRRSRLLARGMSPQDIDRRIENQLSTYGWLAYGKWRIDTSGTFDEVTERVKMFWDYVILD